MYGVVFYKQGTTRHERIVTAHTTCGLQSWRRRVPRHTRTSPASPSTRSPRAPLSSRPPPVCRNPFDKSRAVAGSCPAREMPPGAEHDPTHIDDSYVRPRRCTYEQRRQESSTVTKVHLALQGFFCYSALHRCPLARQSTALQGVDARCIVKLLEVTNV